MKNGTYSMNKLFYVFLLILEINPQFLFCQNNDSSHHRDTYQQLDDKISEIRRDQLNYKIEKDLLKETFSSNFQTINVVITIILGIFSIIGFLGIRDIGSINKKYLLELERLNQLRNQFEAQIKQYEIEQNRFKEDFKRIIKTNDEQNIRIKVLELQEKILSLISNKNYLRALEYIAAALELDPNNIMLLTNKGTCLWKSKNYNGSIEAFIKVIELDPSNYFAIENLAELYVITKKIKEFKDFYGQYREFLKTIDNGAVITYFDGLSAYLDADLPKMKAVIKALIETLTYEKTKKTNWDFSDIKNAFQLGSKKPIDSMLSLLIKILHGEVNKDEANNILATIK